MSAKLLQVMGDGENTLVVPHLSAWAGELPQEGMGNERKARKAEIWSWKGESSSPAAEKSPASGVQRLSAPVASAGCGLPPSSAQPSFPESWKPLH